MIHIAGLDVQVGNQLRQRCSWCGACLIDLDLTRIAVPEGQDPRPGTWPIGGLVSDDRGVAFVVEHEDGDQLPDGCCGKLDPAVTA